MIFKFQSAIPSLINQYPMQVTGMSIKNVKALFLILNHCNCINSNGIKQQLLLSRKFIWKYFCQRFLKRRAWTITGIWLFDVMNLSNFLLLSIVRCIIYWKLQRCIEYQLKANNRLSGQNILYWNVHVQIISNGKNIIQSGRSPKIDIF